MRVREKNQSPLARRLSQQPTANYLHVCDLARKDTVSRGWIDRINGVGGVALEMRGLRISMVHRTVGQSVAAVTDDLGTVLRREEFTAFGASKARSQATSVGPTGGWEEGFHGIRADELMVAGGRAYDSERGSWLSRDPLAMGNPGRC
jgi:hypothetical protein